MTTPGPEASIPNPVDAALQNTPDLAGLEPIEKITRRWPTILGAILTIAMVVALGHELFGSGLAGLRQTVPTSPLFYLAIVVYYLGPPTSDYIIYRRLWAIPLDGLAALHKKRIANEVLFGYSGEAYFYAWARQRTQMVAAPFGAVKDVTIQSAIAGNTFTFVLIVMLIPFMNMLPPHLVNTWTVAGAAAITMAMNMPFLLFSKRVFSLPRRMLLWVFSIHTLRLIVGTLALALAWHFAMPEVAVGTWVFLAAGRMLMSRAPLPNKEVVFATVTIALLGSDNKLTELMAFVAALTLLTHVALILIFSAQSAAKRFGWL